MGKVTRIKAKRPCFNKPFRLVYPWFVWLVGSKNDVCYCCSMNAIIQFVVLAYLKKKKFSFQIRVVFHLLRTRCKSIGYMIKTALFVR